MEVPCGPREVSTTRTAIVVDDSMSARAILQRMLERLGYAVEAFAAASPVLRRLLRGPLPRVLLVDWNMPVTDGLALIRAVRARPEWRGMRIMMVSAEGAQEHIEHALASGADEYLMKPCTLESLQSKLELLEVSL